MLGHIAEGSVAAHDMEKAHNALIREVRCVSEPHRADVRDPEYLECMSMANSLRSWPKRCIWRFVGMDPKNLQSYLNCFVYLFRVRQAEERWPIPAFYLLKSKQSSLKQIHFCS